MSAPTITQDQIIQALKVSLPNAYNIPLYGEFPSDSDIVRFGIYTSEVFTVNRIPNQLGVTTGGSVYNAIDQFQIVYISFQDDSNIQSVNGIISNLVTHVVPGTSIPLFDGYFERDHSTVMYYGVNSEKFTWTFNLTRLEFQ